MPWADCPVLSRASTCTAGVPDRSRRSRFVNTMDEAITTPRFPSPDEREAALLGFQKAVARLVHTGCISTEQSVQMVRTANRGAKASLERRDGLRELVLAILLSADDGTLREGGEIRTVSGRLALHLESLAPALYRAQRSQHGVDELRRYFKFGVRHFPDVVVGRSDRVTFGPEEDRRRAVVLDVERAWEFVGGRPRSVPVR